jgi:hypothetical protein
MRQNREVRAALMKIWRIEKGRLLTMGNDRATAKRLAGIAVFKAKDRILREYYGLRARPLTPGTLRLRELLESWFKGVEEIQWDDGEIRFAHYAPGEMELRSKVVEWHEKAKSRSRYLATTIRDAMLKLDAESFRHMAGMCDFIREQEGRPVDPVRVAILEVAQTVNAKADAARGEPSSGLEKPPPATLPLTISQLLEYVEWRTGSKIDARQLRRACKELGTSPMSARRGPRPKAKSVGEGAAGSLGQ